MDELEDVGIQQEVEIRSKRQKNILSKFFVHLLFCLENEKHKHMLWYIAPNKFQVKMVDMKSRKKWRKEDISLFQEMDSLYGRDQSEKNYEQSCKVRFKSNMSKLKTYFKEIEMEQVETCVTIRTYEILKSLPNDNMENDKLSKKFLKSTTKGKKVGHGSGSTSVTPDEFVQTTDDLSHSPCLSQIFGLKENKFEMIELIDDIKAEYMKIGNKRRKLFPEFPISSIEDSLKNSRDPLLSFTAGSGHNYLQGIQHINLDVNTDGNKNTCVEIANTSDSLTSEIPDLLNFGTYHETDVLEDEEYTLFSVFCAAENGDISEENQDCGRDDLWDESLTNFDRINKKELK